MAEQAAEKSGWKAKLMEELDLLALIGIYIWLVLTMLDLYRRTILAGQAAEPWKMGVNAVEALIFAKVVIIEDLLKVSHKYSDRSLVIPTLYRALIFGVFAIIVSSLELLIKSLLHGDSAAAAIDIVLNKERGMRLTHAALLTLSTLPLFATWELARVIGGKKLEEMFFGKKR